MTAPLYWDSSAILSVLLVDRHSRSAHRRIEAKGPHLISSLAFVEVCAVVTRLAREGHLSARERRLVIGSLEARPWSALHLEPDRRLAASLADRHALCRADLWHLAAAATLGQELPGLFLVTFDASLAAAAEGEGLTPLSSP